MKVAVVLTGHLRCWKTVFPNFKQTVIDRYNPDIFIHTWDDEGYWVPQEGPMGIKEHCPAIDEVDVRSHYNPVSMVVENFLQYEPKFAERVKSFTNYYHRPRNIISMFYKMLAGFQLVEDHVAATGTKYDLVIRMRPDMILHDPLPEFDPSKFYTLAHRNHMGGGTGDMFQIGSFYSVMTFTKLGLMIEELYKETGLLCPHELSSRFIATRLGVPHQEFHINKTIQHTPNGQYQAC